MRRLMFGVLLSFGVGTPLAGQDAPGRDLLLFPLGALAEPPALATTVGLGLRNPAAIALADSARLRGTVGALSTPAEAGASMQVVEAAARLPAGFTASLSALRGAVDDLVRTDDSPLGRGEISYDTWVLSAGVAHRRRNRTVGVAVRHRSGQLDGVRRGLLGVDAGVLVEDLLGVHGRVAASTFLWRPGSGAAAHATLSLAADARAWGRDAHHEVRVGYGYGHTESLSREHYIYGGGRWGRLEARAGVAALDAFGSRTHRLRLGVGLHHARYLVGIGREESGAGLGPTYQFTLSATIP